MPQGIFVSGVMEMPTLGMDEAKNPGHRQRFLETFLSPFSDVATEPCHVFSYVWRNEGHGHSNWFSASPFNKEIL